MEGVSMVGVYHHLGVHVDATDVDVIRAARKALGKPRTPASTRTAREARHAFYRALLEIHHYAQDLLNRYRML